jgi:hypothetical protein
VQRGGGPNAPGGLVSVAGNVIKRNYGTGGGIYAWITRLRFVDNVVISNSDTGAEIAGNNSSVIYMVNNTFAGSYDADVEISVYTGRLAFVNNIIDSTARSWSINCYDDGASFARISNNLIYAPDGATMAGNCGMKSGGLIEEDPQFDGGDGLHAYWLTAGSPAVDAGINSAVKRITKDATGAPRIVGQKVDLRAYEYRGDRVPGSMRWACTTRTAEAPRPGGGAWLRRFWQARRDVTSQASGGQTGRSDRRSRRRGRG